MAISNISDPNVRVVSPAGTTPEGVPYVDFTSLVLGGLLGPGGTTAQLSLGFSDPDRSQFTYDLDFFGLLNRGR